MITRLGPRLFAAGGDEGRDASIEPRVLEAVEEAIALDKTPLTRQERAQVTREIADDILGYGPLEPFLRDDTVSEIMVNGPHSIWVERRGKLLRTDAGFVDDQHLLRIIDKIISRIGRRIDEASPMVDARLPDGSRVNAIIPPLAVTGPTLTIRKFRRDPLTMEDLLRFGTLTPRAAQLLEACVRGKLNILISGGTGSGKTTTLNVLSGGHPRGRAHRHRRGRGRAPAAPGARDHARVPPGQHRGQGHGQHPRPRPQLPAYAARPHHRRRVSWPRDDRHAPGHEHGP